MKGFTKRLYISVILAFIISIACSFLLLKGGIDSVNNRYNEASIYSNSTCNFVIPSPSHEQISDLEENDFINNVEAYYYTETSVDIGNKNILANLVMIDDIESLNCSPYSKHRLLSGKSNVAFSAIVDFTFAKQHKLKVGDSLSVSIGEHNFSYNISAIYQSNTMYNDGVLLINWTQEQKQKVSNSMDAKLNYSGAWVTYSKFDECKDYLLNDYKPLGRLKDREEFLTDEAYQTHLESFNNASFASEIVDFNESKTQVLSKHDGYKIKSVLYFLFAIIVPLLFMVLFGYSVYNKKQVQLIKKAISINSINHSKILWLISWALVLFAMVVIVTYLAFVFLYKSISTVLINLVSVKFDLILVFTFVLLGLIVLLIVNTIKFNNTFRTRTARE